MAIEKNSVVSMFYELKDANTNEVLESNLYAQPIS
ncbi:peptidylprolyl isomerase, partial [Campylobacter coli]|nr:peptidylprolyl isomerase [Campylobacter coli]MDC7792372.1 peptidylprolyl isomerase [Campylobacter coli]